MLNYATDALKMLHFFPSKTLPGPSVPKDRGGLYMEVSCTVMENYSLQRQAEQFKSFGSLSLSICRLVAPKERVVAAEPEPHKLPPPESRDAEASVFWRRSRHFFLLPPHHWEVPRNPFSLSPL